MGDTTKKHNSDRRENILFPIPTITIILVYLYLYYFYKKKHCSNKMNQNLDHASHVREHQKKPYEQGKNVFFFPISTRGKKVFATREKKSSSTKNTMKSGKNSYITG